MGCVVVDEMVSRKAAAKTLGVSLDSVKRWISEGDLIVVRLGRRVMIERRELVAFVEKRRVKKVTEQ
jgi:excisionase family DNA binding protein